MLAVGATTVAVRIDDDRVRRLVAESFAGLRTDRAGEHQAVLGGQPGDRYTLTIDDQLRYGSVDPANVLDHLVAWCNREAVLSRVGEVNIHAAAVVPPGRAGCAILPAPPGAGKTTLAAAACAAGFGYLSDELVSLDEHGTAHGYAKPLTIKAASRPLIAADYDRWTLSAHQTRWYLRPEDLGGTRLASAEPAALVFARYVPERETSCTELGVTETVVELAINCQDQLDGDGHALETLARLAARCQRVRLDQRDLDQAVAILEAVVARPAPSPSPVRRLEPVLRAGAPVGPAAAPGAVGVVCADGVVVHHPPTDAVVALDALAGVVWQLLDGNVPEAELARELSSAFDHPEDQVQRDVAALLTELRSHQLVIG